MSDEELSVTDATLTARLRNLYARMEGIEQLVKERDAQDAAWSERIALLQARAERLEAALREIAAEASVPVRTWKNGINFKKMYKGWRKIAAERIDIARAALKGDDHE